jgi:uncharacterized membrane protein
MSWFFIALCAPALWSVTNHIDKFLLGKYFKQGGEGALLIFSCAIALVSVPVIGLFAPHVFAISFWSAVIMIGDGMLYVLALIPYMYAMQKDEASIVVPLFQLVAVFGYIFGLVFLNEHLSLEQLIASAVIIGGAVYLSLDLSGAIRIKGNIFGLMCLSSFLLAINAGVFKLIAVEYDFWTTLFWDYVGLICIGALLLLFVRKYREQFFAVIRVNTASALGLNGVNEVLNILAEMSMKFATTIAPIALVLVVNGLQPMFVFVYGIILTRFFPSIAQENMARKHLVQKCIAIVLMCIGSYWISVS